MPGQRNHNPLEHDHRSTERAATSVHGLLASKEIIVACGPGGVGKTTTAAAAGALAAWRLGGKVLVLTVDPARRLANALGLEGFGNVERQVPGEAFVQAGVKPMGEMWAAMLDTKQSWDDLVKAHAPDVQTRDAILCNSLYRDISGRFVQSHDYIAMERLFEIHSTGNYDLIVVDTPPTRNAIDFLDAPERMADFFSSRLLRWIIAPYRSRLVSAASRPFYQVADRILGTQFLEDISEFFVLFQSMYEGFVERARAVKRLLADHRTSFIVVSTLETVPLREAEFFAEALVQRRLHLGAIILNKVLPSYLCDPGALGVAEAMRDRTDEISADLAPAIKEGEASQVKRVVAEVARSYMDYRVVAQREAEERAELHTLPDIVVSIPYFDSDIHDLGGLIKLADSLWGEG